MNEPKILLAELREYVSARTGRPYMAGFMGKTKLVLLRDDRAEPTGNEVARWNLFIEQAQPRATQAANQPAPATSSGCPVRTTTGEPNHKNNPRTLKPKRLKPSQDARARETLRSLGVDPAAPVIDDAIPF